MQLVDYLPIAIMFVLALAFVGVSLFVSKFFFASQPHAGEAGALRMRDPARR